MLVQWNSYRKEVIRLEVLSRYIVILVLAICLCLGYIIKHSISFIPNKYIPLIMGVAGVILNLWLNNWTFTPEVLLGGLASGLASTGTHELVRNLFPRETVGGEQSVTTASIKKSGK